MNVIKELENLAQFLRGAGCVSDNEKIAQSFHESSYRLEQVIQEIKQNHSKMDTVYP